MANPDYDESKQGLVVNVISRERYEQLTPEQKSANELFLIDEDPNSPKIDYETSSIVNVQMRSPETMLSTDVPNVGYVDTQAGITDDKYTEILTKLDNDYISKTIYDEQNADIKRQLDEI